MNENDKSAFGFNDDPNQGPLDRTANNLTGGTGGVSAATTGSSHDMANNTTGGVVSAIFDSNSEAQQAVTALRQMGASDHDLSIIAQSKGTMTTREGGGEITDEEHTNILRGILGGGALGAGIGVAALAIPGVGPLAAIGAIAAAAAPEAMAIGALAGAAAGTFNEALKKHGVSDDDSAYYGERLKSGGVVVTVRADNIDSAQAQEILYDNGGHSASRARTAAM